MKSLLWWGVLTNQNHAWPVGVYGMSLPWVVTMGVNHGRLPQEVNTGVYHRRLLGEVTTGVYRAKVTTGV